MGDLGWDVSIRCWVVVGVVKALISNRQRRVIRWKKGSTPSG